MDINNREIVTTLQRIMKLMLTMRLKIFSQLKILRNVQIHESLTVAWPWYVLPIHGNVCSAQLNILYQCCAKVSILLNMLLFLKAIRQLWPDTSIFQLILWMNMVMLTSPMMAQRMTTKWIFSSYKQQLVWLSCDLND